MALFRIGTALDSFMLYRRVLAIIDVYMCECIPVFEHVHFSTCPCPTAKIAEIRGRPERQRKEGEGSKELYSTVSVDAHSCNHSYL